MSNFYCTSTDPENPYRDSTTTTDNSINNSSTMNDIKIGQLYQHTPTRIVRRVVSVGDNYVTLQNNSNSRCLIRDFSKFWKPYEASDNKVPNDKVNHPSHYTWLKDLCGIEVIDITRHMDFNLGNSIKYILRSGHKKEEGYTDKQKTIEDLKKAVWYLNDEIKLLSNE